MSLRKHHRSKTKKMDLIKVKRGGSTCRRIPITISQNNSDSLKRDAHSLQTFNKHHAKTSLAEQYYGLNKLNKSGGDLVPRIFHLLNPSFWVAKMKDPTNEIGVEKSGPRLQRQGFAHLLINAK